MGIDSADGFSRQRGAAVALKQYVDCRRESFDDDEMISYTRNKLISHIGSLRERNLETEIDSLADSYDSIRRADGESEGMKIAHGLFMESLCFADYMPVMKGAKTYLDEEFIADKTELLSAVDALADVMAPVKEYSEKEEVSLYEAFLDLYADAQNGGNDLLLLLKKAREDAYRCVKKYRKLMKDCSLAERADDLMMKHEELESGMEFPPAFIEKLYDSKTKLVVVSLDFNSTFNSGESYSAVDLSARVQSEMRSLVRVFRRRFPDKQLFLVINTGRPGLYAWGVAESAFAPIAELRNLAVAESGGVILESGLNSGAMRVAVENPMEWGAELGRLKDYLLSQIADSQKVAIEPKLSMLSMKLMEKGESILKMNDGRIITPYLIGEQIQKYFESVEVHIESKFRELVDELYLEFPDLKDWLVGGITQSGRKKDGTSSFEARKKILEGLKEAVFLMKEEHQKLFGDICARSEVLELMFEKGALVANFNPTAGYVDIGHRDVNKFSTLMGHVTDTQGIGTDEVLYVQIGDSTTDILPTEKTGEGEPNEGADEAFLIAVNNCNEKMQTAVEERGQRGLFTRNREILAVEAMFKGLKELALCYRQVD